MILDDIWDLVKSSEFADLGFVDSDGKPHIRKVFCTWHKGLKVHLISTNTSSFHVQMIKTNPEACLYFSNTSRFQGLCLYGQATVHFENEYRELLWTDDSIKYYPDGVSDKDYCVIKFQADSGKYYGALEKYTLTREDINSKKFENESNIKSGG